MKNKSLKFALIIMVTMYAALFGLYIVRDTLVKRGYRVVMWTHTDYINAAEYYMRKKYGEKFEAYRDDYGYWLETVSPKAHPEWSINIDIEIEGGRVHFHDNYVGYLKKAELEKYIYELVKPIYGECKVYTKPYGFRLDDSWNRNTDMMTYVSRASYNTYIFTYGEIKSKEADIKKVSDIFIDKKLRGDVIYITYLTKEDFEKFEEKDKGYTFSSKKYYYRLDILYLSDSEEKFSEINILKGADDYGK